MGEYLIALGALSFLVILFLTVSALSICRAEIEMYKTLDPGVRVVILKALCDIRVEVSPSSNHVLNYLCHIIVV